MQERAAGRPQPGASAAWQQAAHLTGSGSLYAHRRCLLHAAGAARGRTQALLSGSRQDRVSRGSGGGGNAGSSGSRDGGGSGHRRSCQAALEILRPVRRRIVHLKGSDAHLSSKAHIVRNITETSGNAAINEVCTEAVKRRGPASKDDGNVHDALERTLWGGRPLLRTIPKIAKMPHSAIVQ